ncbi:MAG: transposase, partial [Solirubrobacterales bacterium]|nr:transposase [Solirubrobacterales bacterium]
MSGKAQAGAGAVGTKGEFDDRRRARLRPPRQLAKLTRQGSASLRWALFEAAQSASHRTSPDYHDYHALKARGLSHTRATLTIARKLAGRSYPILRALGPAALDPPDQRSDRAHPSPMRSK